MRLTRLLFPLFLIFVFSAPFAAAEAPQEIEIVFDASGSMNDAMAGQTKLDVAKSVLTTVAGQIAEGANVGLRIFGATQIQGNVKDSCVDSVLAMPISAYQKDVMISKVQALQSYGMTALGYSLQKAGDDFSKGDVKRVLILISDGEETCGVDPLQVVNELKAKGIEFTIHAVSFDASDAAKKQLNDLSQATGGTYHEAKDAAELQKSLESVVQETKLLKPQSKEAGENLISAVSGATVVSATSPALAELVDGSEKAISETIEENARIAVGFKNGSAALVDSVAVPIFEKQDENLASITVLGSIDKPDSGYFVIQKFDLKNEVNFDNVYQQFKLNQPQPLRYIKFLMGKSFKGGGVYKSYGYELKAYGKLLSEDEFKTELAKVKRPEMNVLAIENGGKMIAATNEKFKNANDGADGLPGSWGGINPGDEGVFELAQGKTYMLTSVAVAVSAADPNNCRHFDIEVSETAPNGPYTKAGSFEISNMVFADSIFQKFNFEKPVKAKYLKIRIVDGYGPSFNYCPLEEVQAFGTAEV